MEMSLQFQPVDGKIPWFNWLLLACCVAKCKGMTYVYARGQQLNLRMGAMIVKAGREREREQSLL